MPAMPAPSTSTDVPVGGADSLIGPLKVEVSAKASSVMAWYMAALPATTPIMLRRERLEGACGWSVMFFLQQRHCMPRDAARSCLESPRLAPVVCGACRRESAAPHND